MSDQMCTRCGWPCLCTVRPATPASSRPVLPALPPVIPGMKWAPPPAVVVPMFTPNRPPITFTAVRIPAPACAAAANLGFVPWPPCEIA